MPTFKLVIKEFKIYLPILIPLFSLQFAKSNQDYYGGRSQSRGEVSQLFDSHKSNIEHLLSLSASQNDNSKLDIGSDKKHCALPLPIETFMEPPVDIRRQQFLLSVRKHDLLVCRIVSKDQYSTLNLLVLACDDSCELKRDLTDLNIKAVCLFMNAPRQLSQEARIGDLVRCMVLDCQEGQPVNLSLLQQDLPESVKRIKLGFISSNEMPRLYHLLAKRESPVSFHGFLVNQTEFKNPGATTTLCKRLGIDEKPLTSLLHCVNNMKVDPAHTAKELRDAQNRRLALRAVAKGVEHFRAGNQTLASQCYESALAIDPSNVEALVARGALFATNGSSEKAVADFEAALATKPSHKNARIYLAKTLFSLAEVHAQKGNTKSAMLCCIRALHLDPKLQQAIPVGVIVTPPPPLILITVSMKESTSKRKRNVSHRSDSQHRRRQERKRRSSSLSPPPSHQQQSESLLLAPPCPPVATQLSSSSSSSITRRFDQPTQSSTLPHALRRPSDEFTAAASMKNKERGFAALERAYERKRSNKDSRSPSGSSTSRSSSSSSDKNRRRRSRKRDLKDEQKSHSKKIKQRQVSRDRFDRYSEQSPKFDDTESRHFRKEPTRSSRYDQDRSGREEYNRPSSPYGRERRKRFDRPLSPRDRESRDRFDRPLSPRERESRDRFDRPLSPRGRESRDRFDRPLSPRGRESRDRFDRPLSPRGRESRDRFDRPLSPRGRESRERFDRPLSPRGRESRERFDRPLSPRGRESRERFDRPLSPRGRESRERFDRRQSPQDRDRVTQERFHESYESSQEKSRKHFDKRSSPRTRGKEGFDRPKSPPDRGREHFDRRSSSLDREARFDRRQSSQDGEGRRQPRLSRDSTIHSDRDRFTTESRRSQRDDDRKDRRKDTERYEYRDSGSSRHAQHYIPGPDTVEEADMDISPGGSPPPGSSMDTMAGHQPTVLSHPESATSRFSMNIRSRLGPANSQPQSGSSPAPEDEVRRVVLLKPADKLPESTTTVRKKPEMRQPVLVAILWSLRSDQKQQKQLEEQQKQSSKSSDYNRASDSTAASADSRVQLLWKPLQPSGSVSSSRGRRSSPTAAVASATTRDSASGSKSSRKDDSSGASKFVPVVPAAADASSSDKRSAERISQSTIQQRIREIEDRHRKYSPNAREQRWSPKQQLIKQEKQPEETQHQQQLPQQPSQRHHLHPRFYNNSSINRVPSPKLPRHISSVFNPMFRLAIHATIDAISLEIAVAVAVVVVVAVVVAVAVVEATAEAAAGVRIASRAIALGSRAAGTEAGAGAEAEPTEATEEAAIIAIIIILALGPVRGPVQFPARDPDPEIDPARYLVRLILLEPAFTNRKRNDKKELPKEKSPKKDLPIKSPTPSASAASPEAAAVAESKRSPHPEETLADLENFLAELKQKKTRHRFGLKMHVTVDAFSKLARF
uniref:TPR_REGION domain-containing protein n=1 Tax=Macrostomum lignano TaxID=282301 RepID=A0A1I8HGM5_9PLAT